MAFGAAGIGATCLSVAALLCLSICSSTARAVRSCPENCTILHQREFAQELRNFTKGDVEIVNLEQLVSFMQYLYSQIGDTQLERICDMNRQLNSCLSDCADNLEKDIHTKKSSIYFLMCDKGYRNYASCLMNSTFRSSSFKDKIEMTCDERVSDRHPRSLWERLCQMARCRLFCLKKPITTICGSAAYETAKTAAMAAIDEYEGTYLSQAVPVVQASARTAVFDYAPFFNETGDERGGPTFWNVVRDNFSSFCDRKNLFDENDDHNATECGSWSL